MSGMMNLISAGMMVADTERSSVWREEDNERRLIDNTRRLVDEKTRQLSAVSQLSALVAGFSMVVLVELNYSPDCPTLLLAFYGLFASATVALNVMAMMSCVLMLVGVLKYDCVRRRQPFRTYWSLHCEAEWSRAFKCFNFGIPTFLMTICVTGWVKFDSYRSSQGGEFVDFLAPSLVSLVAVFTLVFWLYESNKWSRFLSALSTNTAEEIAHRRVQSVTQARQMKNREDSQRYRPAPTKPAGDKV
jgi:calcium release-activated calcium channel protein 1